MWLYDPKNTQVKNNYIGRTFTRIKHNNKSELFQTMKLIKKNTEYIILDLQYSGHKSCLDTKMEIGKILIQIILDLFRPHFYPSGVKFIF